MAKKFRYKTRVVTRKAPRRRSSRSWFRKRFHRVKDKRIPLLQTSAFIANEMGPISKTVSAIQSGDPMAAIKTFAHENIFTWTGLHLNIWDDGYSWDFMQPIYSVGSLIATGLISKAVGKYVNPTLKRIPFLGKYVKL